MPSPSFKPVATQLVVELCLAAGLILEDASVACAQVLPKRGPGRRARVQSLRQAGEDIAALLSAAEVLNRRM
jgi:hypothetical protein